MNDGMKLCVALFTSFSLLPYFTFRFLFFFFFHLFLLWHWVGFVRDIPYIHNFFCFQFD